MTKTLQSGAWRIAVMDDETLRYAVDRWLTWEASEEVPCPDFGRVSATVEIRFSSGGITPRAMLGGTLSQASRPSVRVASSGDLTLGAVASQPSHLSGSLVPGLPEELATGVLDQLTSADAVGSLFGAIVVERGAYDEVDSSTFAFRRAADVLRTVLASRARGDDDIAHVERLLQSW